MHFLIKSGDNYCDDVLNNAECLFDMGDCSSSSGPPTLLPPVWTPPTGPEVPEGCDIPENIPTSWLGIFYVDPKVHVVRAYILLYIFKETIIAMTF